MTLAFSAPRDEFIRVVTLALGVIERTPARLILLNFKLVAEKTEVGSGLVRILATDGKLYLQDAMPANVTKAGEVTVTAKTLAEMLKALPEGEVEAAADENHWMTLTGGKSRFNLPGLPTDEFPSWEPWPEETATHTITNDAFSLMLAKTSFAISDDETRPVLCGLYLEHQESETNFVSTDGHRLAQASTKNLEFSDDFGLIIPKKASRELRRLLGEVSEDVEMAFTDTHQHYRIGGVTLYARNIAGNFPNYRQVVPQEFNTTVRFKRSDMLGLLKRVMLIQSAQSQGMVLNVVEGIMRATAENPELGDVHDEFEVDYAGEPFTVCYNPRYFTEILNVLETDNVSLNLSDTAGPGVILEDSEGNDPRLLYILMPMKLR